MMERRHIRVEGIVQGVGFRPFVYTSGARNGAGGVGGELAAGGRDRS